MLGVQRFSKVSAASLAASAGLLACVTGTAFAQSKVFLPANGAWDANGNWNPNGVPGAGDDVYIYGGSSCTFWTPVAGNAASLNLGGNNTGVLSQSAGLITVGGYTEVGGNPGGGSGTYLLYGTGQLVTNRLAIGRHVDSGMRFNSSMGMRVDDNVYIGGTAIGVFTCANGAVQVRRDVNLGFANGGWGAWNVTDTGTTAVEGNVYVGSGNNAYGRLRIEHDTARFGLGGTMYVGTFNAGAPARQGEVTNAGGRFYDFNPVGGTAKIIVQGSAGRMVGPGTYDVGVRYESNKNFGNSNKSVAVEFKPGVMTRASVMNVANGLTARSGNAAARTAITDRSLPGTNNAVSWGDADFNQSVNYTNPVATPARYTTIEVPFNVSDIPDGPIASRDNTRARVRLMQIGARRWATTPGGDVEINNTTGQIRNITGQVFADKVRGTTPDVFGSFDTAIIAKPVAPQHQDPAFRTLHGGTHNLNGHGVLIGQLEPGLPDGRHGAFDDWSTPGNSRVSYSGGGPAAGAASPHATFVASLMTGYDPLGLQTDGQGRLVSDANGYGPAASPTAGFTGIAPKARLVSRAWTDAAGATNDITTLANVTDPDFGNMKIINLSAGFSQRNGANPRPTGDNPEELAIDKIVKDKGIVFVKSAGNDGTFNGGSSNLSMPAGTYNGIVVGAVEFDRGATPDSQSYPTNFDVAHATVANFSSRGPTNPGVGGNTRSKPDIVAHGVGNLGAFSYEQLRVTTTPAGTTTAFIRDPSYRQDDSHGLYSTQQRLFDQPTVVSGNVINDVRAQPGTSYAAPTVAGTAALMVQEARLKGLPPCEEPMMIKSLLQTTADKPAGWARGNGGVADAANTQIPLSYSWGAGLLDPVGAIRLLNKGTANNTRFITDDGWYFTNLSHGEFTGFRGAAGNMPGDAFMFHDVVRDTPLTITMNWYRNVDDAMTSGTFTKMMLELYRLTAAGIWEPIANLKSDSPVDNLQHIYVPSMPFGGDILARVSPIGVPDAGFLEPYAISWEFTAVPTPGAMALLWMGGFVVLRRRRDSRAA